MKRFFVILVVLYLSITFPASVGSQSDTAPPVDKERVIVTYKSTDGQATTSSVNSLEVKYVSDEELVELSNNPLVATIEKDQVVTVSTSLGTDQRENWGITRLNPQPFWLKGVTGKGIKVAVLDTGVENHEDLVVKGGTSFIPSMESYADDHGHGTHVAGIIGARNNSIGIVGVAPDADIYSVKVLNKQGVGYLSDVIRGIDWSIENEIDIINLSLSAKESSVALLEAVKRAEDNNILIMAAAGNQGDSVADSIGYPAKLDSVIAVGATNELDRRASFSSVGPSLKIVAPGNDILSTYKDNTYKSLNGTSMATPFVAGTAALLLQENPSLLAKEMRELLYTEALDLGEKGVDHTTGYGLLQIPTFAEMDVTILHPKTASVNRKYLIRVRVNGLEGEPLSKASVTSTLERQGKVTKYWRKVTTKQGVVVFPFHPKYAGDYTMTIQVSKDQFKPKTVEIPIAVTK
ncbi:S8 family peptidase [Mangrovibacillus cuniculi]|uniref:S8 family peptidase n=1 Tax=Mangrovibacillus cuniculi TaxID=2593652 RepID=A0A7S8CD45_9BACI|nr:S8 family peptidase [Mangrovibacillus cuniculi]QPC47770.1 S8 family peptidase [Mangrovibacillus cuniculi]